GVRLARAGHLRLQLGDQSRPARCDGRRPGGGSDLPGDQLRGGPAVRRAGSPGEAGMSTRSAHSTRLRRGRLFRAIPAAWRTPLAIVGAAIALAWVVIALIAPWVAPHDPLAQQLPRLTAPGDVTLMGTDQVG